MKKKYYNVSYLETVSRGVCVQAHSKEEAVEKASHILNQMILRPEHSNSKFELSIGSVHENKQYNNIFERNTK